MSKSFESNISQELNIKELAMVAKRIEKYQKELEETLTEKQKMILNNLLCNKSKASAIISMHCINKNNQISESDLIQSKTDVRSLCHVWRYSNMARRILEELYYENIKPRSKNFSHSESYNKSMVVLDKYETLLIELLEGKELKLFTGYVDAWGEVHGTDTTEKWIDGFKIGLQIGMAVCIEEDSCIEDLI